MPSCHLVSDLPPFDAQHNLRVVVETPRGANIKIKYDEDLGCFSLSRILPLGVTYPYDFGFVPQTLAQDGDPLDVMVLIDALTYPGVVISCRLLGALQVEERGLRGRPNHRLVAVPVKAARKDELRNFSDLGRRMQQELERFFVMSSAFTSKDPVVRGWVGPDAAFDMVQRSIARYKERQLQRLQRQGAGSAAVATVSLAGSVPMDAQPAAKEPALDTSPAALAVAPPGDIPAGLIEPGSGEVVESAVKTS
ncbi:MAG: inorganic diphosphatase [Deltaproteobacteria bacterium]|jgi:inorganic pyrophosphatase|nr:inorganic diphosphatase [Deltaproteobacteria bacterium]